MRLPKGGCVADAAAAALPQCPDAERAAARPERSVLVSPMCAGAFATCRALASVSDPPPAVSYQGRARDAGNRKRGHREEEETRWEATRSGRMSKSVELYAPSKRRLKPGPKRETARRAAAERAAMEAEAAAAAAGDVAAERPTPLPPGKYGVGTTVYKLFHDKLFHEGLSAGRLVAGTVVGYRTRGAGARPVDRLHSVTYENGHGEELDETALGQVFVYKAAAQAGETPGGTDRAQDRGEVEVEAGEDLDAPDADDPRAVVVYAAAIHAHHRATEATLAVRPDYLSEQPLIDAGDRAALVDWLIATHTRFRLQPETLHLAVHVADRYLAATVATPSQLRLAGAAALLIAGKYEEVDYPDIEDLTSFVGKDCSREEVLQTEEAVLHALRHRITVPTARAFLPRYLRACRADAALAAASGRILDGTLRSYALLRHPPSRRAAAALFVARTELGALPAWTPALEACAGYTEGEVRPTAAVVARERWPTKTETRDEGWEVRAAASPGRAGRGQVSLRQREARREGRDCCEA